MWWFVSEELILFGFGELDSRMLKMMLEHNEEEEHGSQNVSKFNK